MRARVKAEPTDSPALVTHAAPTSATPLVEPVEPVEPVVPDEPVDEDEDEDVFAPVVRKRKYEYEPTGVDDGNAIEAVMTRAAMILAQMNDGHVDVSLNVVTQVLASNGWNVDDAVDRVVDFYYM